MIVFFSAKSGNTARFVDKLDLPALRIPYRADDPLPVPDAPYILITPTYGSGLIRGAIPDRVVEFLDVPGNARLMRGVVGSGNTNFGAGYTRAATLLSRQFDIPVLHRFELLGLPSDIDEVRAAARNLNC